MSGKVRDWSIEFYRCACMFGVCLLHALDQGGYADGHRGLDNLMTPCVDGFVFISGYFGIRLKLKSVVRLLSTGLYCAVVVGALWWMQHDGGCIDAIKVCLHTFRWAWFLWMYLALMTLAPLVESLFEKSGRPVWRTVLPFLATVFLWSYARTKVPVFKDFLPTVTGFHGFSVLTFFGVYLFGRACRYNEIETKINICVMSIIAVISGAFCFFNFMHYHSPFALVFSASMFYLFKHFGGRFRIRGNFILALSPSMFSVYLIHNTCVGMDWLHEFEDAHVASWGYYPTCMLVALVFFWGAIILDLPRRAVPWGWRLLFACHHQTH